MVALAPESLADLRNRALLLLGFAGAFRRSELVALDVADIAETKTGLLVTIRRSKTDQHRARLVDGPEYRTRLDTRRIQPFQKSPGRACNGSGAADGSIRGLISLRPTQSGRALTRASSLVTRCGRAS
jgi:integrase